MALKIDYTHLGIAIPNCYVRVKSLSADKRRVSSDVTFHATEEKPAFFSASYSFAPNMGGGNFIEQTYEHLKTLPEFAGAKDC